MLTRGGAGARSRETYLDFLRKKSLFVVRVCNARGQKPVELIYISGSRTGSLYRDFRQGPDKNG